MESVFRFLSAPFACCTGSRKPKPFVLENSTGTSILFPLYIYPDPGCWDRLFTVISRHPDQHFTLVINPNSGPGTDKYPDAEYTDGIAKLNVYKNVTLVGYVYAKYGRRDIADVVADIEKYANWAECPEVDIHIDGIFVDEAPGELGEKKVNVGYMKTIYNTTKKAFQAKGSQGYLVTNPGKIVEKVFYEYADSVASYEAAFKTLVFPDTLFTSTDRKLSPGMPTSRQTVLIHSFEGTKRKQSDLVRMLVKKGIGEVYVTTSDPSKGEGDYNKFSDYWEEFVAEMDRANSDTKGS
ncbi:Spherulin-4 [Dactylella cylindrospora]|nr:Spherulin-4 [Dactylella cylindrospora]